MLHGIDISAWNKGIDLSVVDCDFVIVKSTEGTSYVSPEFKRQTEQAIKCNKLLGFYHYANGKDVEAEARHFINTIKPYLGGCILCLDWESTNNKLFNTGSDSVWVSKFCKFVYDKTGVKPLIYTSKSFMPKLKNLNYKMWIAQYANNKTTGYQLHPWNENNYSCTIRQYSSNGKLKGYSGNLDLNKFYGTRVDWLKLTGKDLGANEKSIIELVYEVMLGNYGSGETRVKLLGENYEKVQAMINHIYNASLETLVNETLSGKYGNNPIRSIVLDKRYKEVQEKINGMQ